MENDRMFDMMTKIYGKVCDVETRLDSLETRVGSLENTVTHMEVEHSKKFEALFDGYTANTEAIEKNRIAIEKNGTAIDKNRIAIEKNWTAIEKNRIAIEKNWTAIETNTQAVHILTEKVHNHEVHLKIVE